MPEQSVNFDRAVEYYDNTRGYPAHEIANIIDFINRTAQLSLTDDLLEIGIGTGRVAMPLSYAVRHIYGVDISFQMMNKLREKQSTELVSVAQADAEQLPFNSQQFDGVLLSHILHLVRDMPQVSRELHRVTKRDGKLIHCRTEYQSELSKLDYPKSKSQRMTRSERINHTLLSSGWKVLQQESYRFKRITTPRDLLHELENRHWSSTWNLTDNEIQARLDYIKNSVDTYYAGDINREIETKGMVIVDVWQIA